MQLLDECDHTLAVNYFDFQVLAFVLADQVVAYWLLCSQHALVGKLRVFRRGLASLFITVGLRVLNVLHVFLCYVCLHH